MIILQPLSNYKAALYPVAGAAVGAIVGGPLGAFAGVELGSMAAVGGSLIGEFDTILTQSFKGKLTIMIIIS